MHHNPYYISGVMCLATKMWSYFTIKDSSLDHVAKCEEDCQQFHHYDFKVVKFHMVEDLPLYIEDKRDPDFDGGQTGSTQVVGPFEPSLKTGITPLTPTSLMEAVEVGSLELVELTT